MRYRLIIVFFLKKHRHIIVNGGQPIVINSCYSKGAWDPLCVYYGQLSCICKRLIAIFEPVISYGSNFNHCSKASLRTSIVNNINKFEPKKFNAGNVNLLFVKLLEASLLLNKEL